MTIHADRVRDYMSTDLVTISADTEIMEAVHTLVKRNISGLPVTDAYGGIVGILTERDCIQVAVQAGYYDEIGGKVEAFMTSDVYVVSPDDSLMSVAELFAGRSFRRCPVVEDGRLVGLICRRDILRAMSKGAWFSG